MVKFFCLRFEISYGLVAMLEKNRKYSGIVVGAETARFRHRWFGVLEVDIEGETYDLYLSGTIAQWFQTGEMVEILVRSSPTKRDGRLVLDFDDYELLTKDT